MTGPDPQTKTELRRLALAVRRGRPESERAAARRSVGDLLLLHLRAARTVCAYLPLTTEPLPLELLGQLQVTGVRVLVPVAHPEQPLDWCEYDGRTRRGAFGIDEPAGDRLGQDAAAEAQAILVPALAVDRQGNRLGRGGGHYDRTLADPALPAGQQWIAVVYDDERVDQLPAGRYDVAVRAVVSPTLGVTVV